MSYNTGTSNNLNKILKKFTHNKELNKEITHTRIGNRDLNIYGGSYSIENDLSSNSIQCHEFYKEYFNNIINNSQDEYLTERQLIEDGPLLVDIDLRYNLDITTRQHNKEHIIDLITLYCEHLTQFYNVEDGELIKVYVLEKPNIVRKDKYVKDGIQSWIQNWKKNGWKTAAKKPVKNKELWIELDQLISRHIISWEWVKGHAGNTHNEKADYLARRYIEEA